MAVIGRGFLDEAEKRLEDAIFLQVEHEENLDFKRVMIKNDGKKGLKAMICFVVNRPFARDWDRAEEHNMEFLLPSLSNQDIRMLSISAVKAALKAMPNKREF